MKAYWYTRDDWTPERGNIGDIVSPLILKHVTGNTPVLDYGDGRVLGCGSIIENIHDRDIVWGSGLIQPMHVPWMRDVTFAMLRGPLTHNWLNMSGYYPQDVPYGDPCFLLPEVFPCPHEPIHRIGVVSHYVEKEESLGMFKGGDFHHIDIISDPWTFIRELNSCHMVISSSLHGIVIAEAYGIKALRYMLTDKIIGGDFKFKDYYLGTDRFEWAYKRIASDDPRMMEFHADLIPFPAIDTNKIKQALWNALDAC